ncbi:hypothetical protein ID866_3242 [Astraeus odoratus]|nr:hypothetical protein ID866_3242 [Astraeus odoratus]
MDHTLNKRSLFVATLDSLALPHHLGPPIASAAARTTETLIIVLCSPLFELRPAEWSQDRSRPSVIAPFSRTERWDDVQRLLTYVYVQAARVAQDKGRVLMDISVLLKGFEQPFFSDLATDVDMCFFVEDDNNSSLLPLSIGSFPRTVLPSANSVSAALSPDPATGAKQDGLPPSYPVVAVGGTFDHLHAGHKILLSMAAWIAETKLIVGLTDDVLLQKKSFQHILEPLSIRMQNTRLFLELFRPDLEYELVAITDVYGPTGWDPNIQALVVSKETLSGAAAVHKERARLSLPALQTFIIDVISADSESLDHEDAELLRRTKMSTKSLTSDSPPGQTPSRTLDFSLAGGYAGTINTEDNSDEIRLLYDPTSSQSSPLALSLKATPTSVYRPESVQAIEQARYASRFEAKSIPIRWHKTWVLAPDVTDRHTLGQLARMGANAYQLPGNKNWYELDYAWNINAAGYALETRCHLGKTIVYDTVGKLGWHVDVRKHVIKELIFNVLDIEGPWPDGEDGEEREVPPAREEVDCVDCFKWEFGDFKNHATIS